MTDSPKCHCGNPAVAEQLMAITGYPPFPTPEYICARGLADVPEYLRRPLPDSSPGEQHASQPDAVGHGRRAAALRAGVGG